LGLLAAVYVGGCSKAPSPAPVPGDAVSIVFEARAGDAAYGCASDAPTVPFGDTTLSPGILRLFVHDVELTLTDGTIETGRIINDSFWQTAEVALLDFEDGTARCRGGSGETNAKIVLEKPAAAVKAVAFSIGVPFDQNHADPAKAVGPLSYTSMHWSWKAGYKFLRLDGKTADGGAYGLHMGSTGCEGSIGDVSSCARPNRTRVALENFDPASQKIVLDVAALVASGADETGGGNYGCLGEKTQAGCVPVFRQLGLDFESGAPAASQLVFTAR
jgi:uncharacterized repeat protein (TIGR04052 family)